MEKKEVYEKFFKYFKDEVVGLGGTGFYKIRSLSKNNDCFFFRIRKFDQDDLYIPAKKENRKFSITKKFLKELNEMRKKYNVKMIVIYFTEDRCFCKVFDWEKIHLIGKKKFEALIPHGFIIYDTEIKF
jgi:hypothetical protein